MWINSPLPVCQWRAEPRVQATSPESPGRPVQTSSSCCPTETAWWMGGGSKAQPEPGATGAESTQRRYGGQRDEEDKSAVSSEGHWPLSWSDQLEIITVRRGGREEWGQQTVCVSSWEETRHWSWWEDLLLQGAGQQQENTTLCVWKANWWFRGIKGK